MAITTQDGYVSALAAAGNTSLLKTGARTSVAQVYFSVFDLAGNPGAGVLAGTSTAAGVVPTDLTAGCPIINAFGGGAAGYLNSITFSSSVACRGTLFDMVFKAGAYAFNANTTLAAQPSYASRMPGGLYYNTEIWLETVTAFTGSQSIAVTYTNQDGTAGRTTGTIATGVAPTVGRMLQLPLQSGDTGVQKIESVVSTVSSAGTFNVLVLRRLYQFRVNAVGMGDTHGPEKTGMPFVFADSALFLAIAADSTSTGTPEITAKIING